MKKQTADGVETPPDSSLNFIEEGRIIWMLSIRSWILMRIVCSVIPIISENSLTVYIFKPLISKNIEIAKKYIKFLSEEELPDGYKPGGLIY